MTHSSTSYLLLIGSYAKETEQSIHSVRYSPPSKTSDSQNLSPTLTVINSTSKIVNPSYLTLHPTLPRVYVASEQLDGCGSIAVYDLDPTLGMMTFCQSQKVTAASPCYVTVDASGRYLLSANYIGGSLTLCALREDGSIAYTAQELISTGHGPRLDRQESAHPHAIVFDAQKQRLLVTDLGLDEIVTYDLERTQATLTKTNTYRATPGSGPRLFLFHPKNSTIGYAICELNNTIVTFHYDPADGSLQPKQTVSTLPKNGETTTDATVLTASDLSTASHMAFSPDARFLYASNRGHDSLVVYAIEAEEGSLQAIQWIATQGRTPRHFVITADGLSLLVANQDSDSIVIFAIDMATGLLRLTDTYLSIASPSCIAIVK